MGDVTFKMTTLQIAEMFQARKRLMGDSALADKTMQDVIESLIDKPEQLALVLDAFAEAEWITLESISGVGGGE